MQKFLVSENQTGVFLNYKVNKSQQFNMREIELFGSEKLAFIIPFTVSQMKNSHTISYNISGHMTLTRYLKAITDKQKFFDVVASFVRAIRECEANRLYLKNVLFDFNYIYVQEQTKKISFIYVPIMDFQNLIDVQNTFMELAFVTLFPQADDTSYVTKYIQYLKGTTRFSLVEFEIFVKSLSNGLYKETKEISKPLDVNQAKDNSRKRCLYCGAQISPIAKFCDKCGKRISVTTQTSSVPPLFVPMTPNTPYSTPPPQQPMQTPRAFVPLPTTVPPQWAEPSSGTIVLGEDNSYGTTVLSQEELCSQSYPYLIRINGNEKIAINKPVFRLGKEKSYVDYFIADNGAVSRSHADIITRGNTYFVIDHDSTNKTHINGQAIPPNVEVQIGDRTKIGLANEGFIFYIN